jgi:tRNA-2-methylthio-N6-dimethylallyladenosine synthase
MNIHDSEKIAGILESLGYKRADRAEDADFVLLNTCSIREKAAQKAFTRLGRLGALKKKKPGMILAVGGCVAQQEKELFFEKAPQVDIVIGPKNYGELPEMLREYETGGEPSMITNLDALELHEPDHVPRNSRVKAYVTIMEGCNNFCTYCIVPYVRGLEISRPADRILGEITRLADQGTKEVELLGQNVNSYRCDGLLFPNLLARVAVIAGIERVRFTTSHPKDFTLESMEVMAKHRTICNHLHLPVQSGSTKILELMNRGYTAESYRDKIEALKRKIPPIAVTTDFIVGFPGESEEDFQATLDLIRDVRFDGIFSFKYSPRPFTKASHYPDTVPEEEKQRRLGELHALQREIQSEKYRSFVGTCVEVLIDGFSKKDPNCPSGRTSDNKVVNLREGKDVFGRMVMAKIVASHPNSLSGEICH